MFQNARRVHLLVGGAIGLNLILGAGVSMGAMPRPMNIRGVGVTELVFPSRQLAGWIAAAVVAGLLAAALPARTASRMCVLDAVGEE